MKEIRTYAGRRMWNGAIKYGWIAPEGETHWYSKKGPKAVKIVGAMFEFDVNGDAMSWSKEDVAVGYSLDAERLRAEARANEVLIEQHRQHNNKERRTRMDDLVQELRSVMGRMNHTQRTAFAHYIYTQLVIR
jgi:hypothetical protein